MMEQETHEEAGKRLSELMEKIMNDKEGRGFVSTIITSNQESARHERTARAWDNEAFEAETNLAAKFGICSTDLMNIKIAIGWKGIEEIWKKHKIERSVV